jgi:predicted dehydrogenase
MKKLRWGFLSTARINRALMPAIKASKGSELAAVASRSLDTARAYAAEYHIPKAYGSYDALLADPDIDAIYNPLPNNLHAEWTIRAAQAGKHILCEKPLALSLAEVDAMTEAARRNNVVLMEAFMYRHHPKTLKIRELIAAGEIGEVRLIEGSFCFTLERPDDIRWKPEQGGGALWDVGCYPVSYSHMLAGCAPVEVFGRQKLSPSGVDVTFAGQLRFPNGILSQISASFELPSQQEMIIRGSRGAIHVSMPFNPTQANSFTVIKKDSEKEYKFKAQELYLGEVQNMESAIREGSSTRLSLAESREILTTLLALYQSARTGAPVPLP